MEVASAVFESAGCYYGEHELLNVMLSEPKHLARIQLDSSLRSE